MERLRATLEIPAYYICDQKTKATGIEALMIMLRRLAYPNRLCDLVPIFGRTKYELSLIFNRVRFIFMINKISCTISIKLQGSKNKHFYY